MNQAKNSWFTNFNLNSDAPVRLFAFPFAGGGSAVFRQWPSMLTGVEVMAAKLPGRESRVREPAFRNMGDLVEALVPEIAPLLTKRYYFFGHSLGALVSFELARTLVKLGHPGPSKLFVSAFRSPDNPPTCRVLHGLPDSEFVAELQAYGGLPAQVLEREEILELLMPTLRADFSVFETHRFEPGPPVPFPIHAFCGSDDPVVSREEMLGWKHKTGSSFSLSAISGDHFFLMSAQRQLLAELQLQSDRVGMQEPTTHARFGSIL